MTGKSDRYKRLFSNTLILGLGTLGSKLLTFLLTRLYTGYLSPGEYGVLDLIIQSVNLLIPLVSLGMNTAVLRFAMDGETDRTTVLSTGLVVDLCGFGGLLLLFPLISRIPDIGDYSLWMYLYIFCSLIHYLFAYFVKTLQKVRLFAIASLIGTAATLLLDILFIAVLQIGVVGYILAIVLADLLQILILFFAAKLYTYIRLDSIRKKVTAAMLKYSIPLIPTTALWWVTDASDRFMVTNMISESANGLYAAAYKVPNLLILISGVFMDAWHMSILTEKSALERQTFFSKIFSMYQSIIFVCSSGLILCSKLVTSILVAPEYYDSWQYMPTLVVAMAISNMVSFIGTIYTVEKRTQSALWTTVMGTIVNLVGNFVLIKQFGVHGAALSTAISYAFVLALRSIHTRRWIAVKWDLPRFTLSAALIIIQCVVMVFEVPYWQAIETAMLLVVLLLHWKPLLAAVGQIIGKRGRKDAV